MTATMRTTRSSWAVRGLRGRVADAGRLDHGAALAPDDEGPRQQLPTGLAGHGAALTGDHRLVQREVVGEHDARIGPDAVARLQDEQVADDQRGDVDRLHHAVPHDPGGGREQLAQPFGGPVGAVLLPEREHAVEQDDDHDGHGQRGHPREEGEDGGRPEQQREQVRELPRQVTPQRRVRGVGQDVGSVGGEAARSLVRRESLHDSTLRRAGGSLLGPNVPTARPGALGAGRRGTGRHAHP
ncbi:hypothetical protein GCM10011376_17310 [Nocardioides flavus (ex Wang et al. 2016)]|uniref:Uncharacterized protein n=1 Tax=Nocardioides flavus (ex Wang et al. 2016) TaxID=2058780 RepID=A0ABQ3HIK0_9ACTN|nr:hypothetical protein GCM10011376_17310 [Nocardioides flavus (ex Wang et al. 2016)]